MRHVKVQSPSFPQAPAHQPLPIPQQERWRVLCGDEAHWRIGIYSPPETRASDIAELERHDCPEVFVLQSGSLTLLIAEGGALRELPLVLGAPVVVTAPHCGFCPKGPHTGVALVVERDVFTTEYRSPQEWL